MCILSPLILFVSWSSLLRHCAAMGSSCALFLEMLLTSATRTGMDGREHHKGGIMEGRDSKGDESKTNRIYLKMYSVRQIELRVLIRISYLFP